MNGPSSQPLLDNVVESVDGFILIELLYSGVLVLVVRLLHFLHEGLELSELVQEWLMGQELYVLCIVVGPVGGVALVHLLEAFWLVRVDAL